MARKLNLDPDTWDLGTSPRKIMRVTQAFYNRLYDLFFLKEGVPWLDDMIVFLGPAEHFCMLLVRACQHVTLVFAGATEFVCLVSTRNGRAPPAQCHPRR